MRQVKPSPPLRPAMPPKAKPAAPKSGKGGKGGKSAERTEREKMGDIAYDKALAALRNGKQVMVFVHARNETVRTARALAEEAKKRGEEDYRQYGKPLVNPYGV